MTAGGTGNTPPAKPAKLGTAPRQGGWIETAWRYLPAGWPRTILALAALTLSMVPPAMAAQAPPPPDVHWDSFDSLVPYDREIAEQALAPMFGADPSLWPDWLDPRVALLPGPDGPVMVVREPLRATCGDYGFILFGPYQPPDGYRQRLGEVLCADGLEILPRRRQAIPDLILKGTNFPDGEGWIHRDQRMRWSGENWREAPADSSSTLTLPWIPR